MAIINIKDDCLDIASRLLIEGKNVILPSDTVYGILANSFDENSVNGIYRVKKRNKNNPIGIFTTKYDIEKWAVLNDYAEKFIQSVLPAPVGLILKKRKNIPDFLTSGRDTVMVMCHESWLINGIYEKMGVPIAASSVNISGQDAAISFEEVIAFEDNVDLLIDGGITKYQLNGTVLDLTGKPTIQREGAYPTHSIRQIIPEVVCG